MTLEQLLSHTSGIPSDDDEFGKLLEQSFAQDQLSLDELRCWVVERWSTRPLQSSPVARFACSNTGYMLAGAMLERTGGKTWEELVAERVLTLPQMQWTPRISS